MLTSVIEPLVAVSWKGGVVPTGAEVEVTEVIDPTAASTVWVGTEPAPFTEAAKMGEGPGITLTLTVTESVKAPSETCATKLSLPKKFKFGT
jgi:hypothetical protein